jgi:spore coat protein U-like protein
MMRLCTIVVMLLAASLVRPAAAASCSAYGSGIAFGEYVGATADITGTITVTCTSGTAYNIGLNAGNTPGATIVTRKMSGGTGGQNALLYQLFSDAARTINWGNSAGTNWVSGTGTGAAQTYTIYGRIPGRQNDPSGSYTDTITASVTGSFTTATAQFSVTATVAVGCTLAATDLNFGAYTGALINSTSVISVDCPPGLKYNLGLDAGTAPGATVTTRSMTGPGGASLGYMLFRDKRRSQNWGNTPGVDTISSSGDQSGRANLWPVYGQLPGGQNANPGAYIDTITATVYF